MPIDNFGRNLYYLRLSITDKCQMTCTYCRNRNEPFIKEDRFLNFDQISRIIDIFKDIGTKKMRITGGEPFYRNDVVQIIEMIHEKKLTVSVTTNGILLKQRLKNANSFPYSINVSLDTLKPLSFEKITGIKRSTLDVIIDSIHFSKESGVPTKINTVLIKENQDEMNELIDFASFLKLPIRFIEYMSNGTKENQVHFREKRDEIISKRQLMPIEESFGDGPAKYFKGKDEIVGFISYSEDHFCDTCNRLRITSDGKLRLCLVLGIEMNLKKMLEEEKNDEIIKEKIIEFVKLKPFNHGNISIIGKYMNRIGG
jgi:cyclic pyranopterin phosphate synthase